MRGETSNMRGVGWGEAKEEDGASCENKLGRAWVDGWGSWGMTGLSKRWEVNGEVEVRLVEVGWKGGRH